MHGRFSKMIGRKAGVRSQHWWRKKEGSEKAALQRRLKSMIVHSTNEGKKGHDITAKNAHSNSCCSMTSSILRICLQSCTAKSS